MPAVSDFGNQANRNEPQGAASHHPAPDPENDRGMVRLDPLRLLDALVVGVCIAYGLAALVGLPLFADGAHYLFRILVDDQPYAPDLRIVAVPPQLPASLASQLGAELSVVRHLFAFGQILLPAGSLAACWLILRQRQPGLMVLPALALLRNQINFSSVSELLAMQYGRLAARAGDGAPHPERRATQACAALAFGALLGLAVFASLVAWRHRGLRDFWIRLALWFFVPGLVRVVWSSLGLIEHYEPRLISSDGAMFYLLTVTWGQHLLLAAVSLLGLAWIWASWRSIRLAAKGPDTSWPPGGWTRRLSFVSVLVLIPLILLVAHEIVWGQGVRLKAALTVVANFVLMAEAGLLGLLTQPRTEDRNPQGTRASSDPDAHGRSALFASLPGTVLALAGLRALLLVKSSAWWTGTRGLQSIVAQPGGACVAMSQQTPYALQWPQMVIVDEWNAPMNALIFRPRVQERATGATQPIALLLPRNGCEWLALTPEAYLTPWLSVSWRTLDQRLGPLRPPAWLSTLLAPTSSYVEHVE